MSRLEPKSKDGRYGGRLREVFGLLGDERISEAGGGGMIDGAEAARRLRLRC